MKHEWVRPDMLVLEYPSVPEMLNATYRFSHCHEYPEWRAKIFTKADLDKHYEETKGSAEWWKTKWGGANLRDTDLAPFIAGKYGELDELETAVLDLVKDRTEPYGIAMYATQTDYVKEHELAHSLYYLSSKYREKVSSLVEEYRKEIAGLEVELSQLYDNENLIDELHAYAGVFYDYWAKPKKLLVPAKLRRGLVRSFHKYIKK